MAIIPPKSCAHCETLFAPPNSRQVYCSKQCGRLHQLPPIEDRIWAKVKKGSDAECWEWTGGCTRAGYGTISYQNRHQYAHRLVYEFTHGAIPDGMLICHTCDNPICVNPAHLWVGTKGDNNRDMIAKGRNWLQQKPERQVRGERQGSAKLTEAAVRDIRMLASQGCSLRELATKYGVSDTTINTVVARKWWKHVE